MTTSTLADVRAAIETVNALTFTAPTESPMIAVRDAIRAAGPITTRAGATWTPDDREQFVSLNVDNSRRAVLTVWGPMTTKAGDVDRAARVEINRYEGQTDDGAERVYAYTKADRYKTGRYEPMPQGARDEIAAKVLAAANLTPAWWDEAIAYAVERDIAFDRQRLVSEAFRPLEQLARKLEVCK